MNAAQQQQASVGVSIASNSFFLREDPGDFFIRGNQAGQRLLLGSAQSQAPMVTLDGADARVGGDVVTPALSVAGAGGVLSTFVAFAMTNPVQAGSSAYARVDAPVPATGANAGVPLNGDGLQTLAFASNAAAHVNVRAGAFVRNVGGSNAQFLGAVLPAASNAQDLGSQAAPFGTAYAGGAATQSFTVGGLAAGSVSSNDPAVVRLDSTVSILTNPLSNAPYANFNWAVKVDGTQNDRPFDVAVDRFGSVYMTGIVERSGTPVATNSGGSNSYTFPYDATTTGAFLVKYASNGAFQWALHETTVISSAGFGYAGMNHGTLMRTIAVSQDGSNVYFGNNITQASSVFQTAAGSNSHLGFVAPDLAAGTIIGATGSGFVRFCKSLDGGWNQFLTGLAVDSSNNPIAVGVTRENFTIDSIVVTSLTPTISGHGYLLKMNSNGTATWAATIRPFSNTTAFSVPLHVAVDAQDNIYVCGQTSTSNAIVNAGQATSGWSVRNVGATQSIFLARFSPSGVAEWVSTIDSTAGADSAFSMVCSGSNITICGQASSNARLYGPSNVGGFSMPNTMMGMIVARYGTDGVPQWAVYGQAPGWATANTVTVDATGNTYVGGQFNGGYLELYDHNGQVSDVITRLPAASGAAAVMFKISPEGRPLYSTITDTLGSTSDTVRGIGVDNRGAIYLGCESSSGALNVFPDNYSASSTTATTFGGSGVMGAALLRFTEGTAPSLQTHRLLTDPASAGSLKYIFNASANPLRLVFRNATDTSNVVATPTYLGSNQVQPYISTGTQWTPLAL